MKQCNLIMVTSENNNKFYNMVENGNVIDVTYGRVGCKETKCTYPISKWDSLKNSKIRKGYKEVTTYKQDIKPSVINEIKNDDVKDIVKILLEKARTSIAENYLVSYKEVTQKQIDEAQSVLDSVLEYRRKRIEVSELNNRLLKLYTIVPRKMKKVQDNLLTCFDTTRLKEIIKTEQELLDTMATQVAQNTDTDGKNILDVAGLTIKPVTKKEEKIILNKLGNNKGQYIRAFQVTNKSTQEILERQKNIERNNIVEEKKERTLKRPKATRGINGQITSLKDLPSSESEIVEHSQKFGNRNFTILIDLLETEIKEVVSNEIENKTNR